MRGEAGFGHGVSSRRVGRPRRIEWERKGGQLLQWDLSARWGDGTCRQCWCGGGGGVGGGGV